MESSSKKSVRYFDLVPPQEGNSNQSASNSSSSIGHGKNYHQPHHNSQHNNNSSHQFHKRLTFVANTSDEASDWIKALEKSISDMKVQQRHSYTGGQPFTSDSSSPFLHYSQDDADCSGDTITSSPGGILKRGESWSSIDRPSSQISGRSSWFSRPSGTEGSAVDSIVSSPKIHFRNIARTLSR